MNKGRIGICTIEIIQTDIKKNETKLDDKKQAYRNKIYAEK